MNADARYVCCLVWEFGIFVVWLARGSPDWLNLFGIWYLLKIFQMVFPIPQTSIEKFWWSKASWFFLEKFVNSCKHDTYMTPKQHYIVVISCRCCPDLMEYWRMDVKRKKENSELISSQNRSPKCHFQIRTTTTYDDDICCCCSI